MKTKRDNPAIPYHELSTKLHEIYYAVGKYPLHKLVPSGYLGAPGFAENGTFVSGDEGKHLSVTCGARYDLYYRRWYCFIQIRDADDMYFDYMRPFTVEEWSKALELYTSLDEIDSETLTVYFHS